MKSKKHVVILIVLACLALPFLLKSAEEERMGAFFEARHSYLGKLTVYAYSSITNYEVKTGWLHYFAYWDEDAKVHIYDVTALELYDWTLGTPLEQSEYIDNNTFIFDLVRSNETLPFHETFQATDDSGTLWTFILR
ncbi:MAG: hypothetical protein RR994_01405 [Clostridia bacterium]